MFPCLLMAAILCSCAALAAEGATVAQLDPERHYKSAAITISGNQKFSESDLRAVMQTKTRPFYEIWMPRPAFDPNTFKKDIDRIRDFYRVHGYYGASVKYNLDVEDKLISAHIQISEGKPVRVAAIRIAVEGNAPATKSLESSFQLGLKSGDTFVQSTYQLGQAQLLNLYMQHGYAHARVRRRAIVYIGPRRADVWYVVTPGDYGVFGPTVIEGTHKVSNNLILRELTYKPGEGFDSRKVAASRAKVVGLNLFSSVEFLPQSDREDPQLVPIKIRVQEKPKHALNLALGYNTESQFNVGAGWNDYNFLGDGRRLTFNAKYSNVVSTADLTLLQPYFYSPKSTLVLEASLYQEVYQTYTLNALRFQPRVNYQFMSHLNGTFGWRLEYLDFNSLNPSTIAAIGGVRRKGILSGPFAQLVWNNTEDPFNPQHGVIATLFANTASHLFGSDYRFWRAIGEIRAYHLLGWETVLAGRFKLGFEHSFGPVDDIPLSERFYSGGEGSVRGYGLRRIGPLSAANQPLGGLSLVEGSVELRRPLFWKIAGAVFFDCGQVSTEEYHVPVDALQCGFGPAVSFVTPVGPLRLDLGIPTKTPRDDPHWQVYFSIGQYF
ncbi:MAG: BamA/TamA family outer membrane protein [Deltaproteobacteria bacterium]|nr:BamA/TamA family outer membrane protein [Deltaproteobacteria bacterium]